MQALRRVLACNGDEAGRSGRAGRQAGTASFNHVICQRRTRSSMARRKKRQKRAKAGPMGEGGYLGLIAYHSVASGKGKRGDSSARLKRWEDGGR